jgi:predicted dehydrogenase
MPRKPEIGVGIIGAGLRGALVLGMRIQELRRETGLRIRALCDVSKQRMNEAATLLQAGGISKAQWTGRISKYLDMQQLIDDPAVDLILITTPTDTHREAAVAALASGKKVYLDKPIAVTLEDSQAILDAEKRYGNRLIMGFTRRYEAPWRRSRELVAEGAIGRLSMMQIRSVIPYTRYYHMWHRRNAWSGGALNDKSSHHFDVFNWFADDSCHSISAIGGSSPEFAPREDHPKGCLSCDLDCPYNLFEDPDFQEMGIKFIPPSWRKADDERMKIDTCVYAPGADIVDHAFVDLAYGNGVVASLFFCIYGPKAQDQETLELVGSAGRILLNRHNGCLELYRGFSGEREVIDCRTEDFESSHFGADRELVRNMAAFVRGSDPPATASDGHESLRMIHAAQASIDTRGARQELG